VPTDFSDEAKKQSQGDQMTNREIVHKLKALEERMGARDQPQVDFEIVFVAPVDGVPGGRIERIVRLSELRNEKG
jgi:hypothetical protein